MRKRRQVAAIWDAIRKNWRVPVHCGGRDQLVPQLFLRVLEERRVLTVGANVGLDLTAAIVEQHAIDQPSGKMAGADAPRTPVINQVKGTLQSPSANEVIRGGAGSQLPEDIASGVAPASVHGGIESLAVGENGGSLTLSVAPDQTVAEGTQLSIPNIGQFTSSAPNNTFTFSIDWGDGRPVDSGGANIDVTGEPGIPTSGSFAGSHVYADNGLYTVTVTVNDDDGGSASGTFMVTVGNVAPTLVVAPDQTIAEGSQLSIPNIGQFTDPGFDNPLNVGGETTERFTFAVDWGDGTEVDSGPATIDVPGKPGVPTSGSFAGSHVYADNGLYTVTVTVNDDDGGSASGTFMVTVGNVAPTLVVAPDQTIAEGSQLSIPNIGQFTDPGFDNPLNVGGETTERFTFAVDWGDGTEVDSGPATIDVPGKPGVPTSGSFAGSHVYADNGLYTVTVTVNDDDGGSASGTFMVTVGNVAPTLVVAPDQTIAEGSQLSIPNIGQFTDPGFDNPLNVGGETTERFTFAVDWGDGTEVDSGPATIDVPGKAGVSTAGSFAGSHVYADNGLYTVTITVSDDDGGSASNTFTVAVTNVPPTLVVATDRVVPQGVPFSIANIGRFTDPGFDNPLNVGGETTERFTFAVDWGDGTEVDSGPATIDVPGKPGVPTSGSFAGSHVYADNGLYTVTVTVNDDDGGSASGTFMVTVGNVAPTLVVAPDQTIAEGSQLSIPNIGQFTDPGFDNPLNVGGETTERFTFAVDWGDGTEVDSGPATIDVPGKPGVPTSGSFAGSHVYADNGLYTVTVTVNDDDGGSASGTFMVTVGNVAPTLVVAPDQTIAEGSQLSIPNIGQFTDPGFDNPLNVGGETTERFTFAVDWGDGTEVDSGPATIDVPGKAGVSTAGSFAGSHVYADNGLYTVTITVSDDDGGSASNTFTVAVTNVPPTLVVATDRVVPQGVPFSIANIGRFTDPGFDNPLNVGGETTERFTFAVDWGDGKPVDSGAGTINVPGRSGVLTSGTFDAAHVYTTSGLHTVTVTISDDDGGSATRSFTILVPPVIRPEQSTSTVRSGGADLSQVPRLGESIVDTRPAVSAEVLPIEVVRFRSGSVAGAETRLVLRIVLPTGVEDKDLDQPLANDVLENLRKLFKRLPDGKYRIYQIQPDGVERLVIDVNVRQGRSIDSTDESEADGEAQPDVIEPDTPRAPPGDEMGFHEESDATESLWGGSVLGLSGAALAVAGGRAFAAPDRADSRLDRGIRRFDQRPLTKVQRLLRRLR